MFNEHGNLHAAATGHVEDRTLVGRRHLQRNIRAAFTLEAIPNLSRGHLLAILPGEWAVVDGEGHLDRRRIDRLERQRFALGIIHQRFADEHVRQASHAHDITGVRFLDLDLLQSLKLK